MKRGERRYCVYGPGNDGFFALLGSPNGASTMRMLHDHKESLGYRRVERVVLRPDDVENPQAPEIRSFAVILSQPRTPPSRVRVVRVRKSSA